MSLSDALTLCFEIPEYYDIAKMYLEAEEPNLDAGYPNPDYWTYESNNVTCRGTLCMEYSVMFLVFLGQGKIKHVFPCWSKFSTNLDAKFSTNLGAKFSTNLGVKFSTNLVKI